MDTPENIFGTDKNSNPKVVLKNNRNQAPDNRHHSLKKTKEERHSQYFRKIIFSIRDTAGYRNSKTIHC